MVATETIIGPAHAFKTSRLNNDRNNTIISLVGEVGLVVIFVGE